ncbi:hypothetical protein NKDENANG_00372 [Candidatus Entotheonellaceae bacterium PAL068K]
MIRNKLSTLAMSWLMVSLFAPMTMAQSTVNLMTTEELKARLDDPDVLVVDVRLGRDWSDSDLKIKGAIRVELRAIASLADTYDKDKTFVFYCA